MDDYWVWSGSPAKGEDGRFHLFASRWPKQLTFHPNWVSNSEVVRAVSDTPEGPYAFEEVVLPPRPGFWDATMTHNPTIHKHGDTWILFYTGTRGIFVSLNDHPHDGIRAHEDCYPEFMNMLGKDPAVTLAFDAGDREYMDAFFKASHTPLEKDGVDFWWVDWQQDYIETLTSVPGVPGLRHLPWLNYLYFENSKSMR